MTAGEFEQALRQFVVDREAALKENALYKLEAVLDKTVEAWKSLTGSARLYNSEGDYTFFQLPEDLTALACAAMSHYMDDRYCIDLSIFPGDADCSLLIDVGSVQSLGLYKLAL